MRSVRTRAAIMTVVAAAAITLSACEEIDTTSTPSTDTTSSSTGKGGPATEGKADEKDDLTKIELDDRSQHGISSIWVTYEIKNNSSKKSNYEIRYEVVNNAGTRVHNSIIFATDVQPGQTTKGEDITTLEATKGMKLRVTSVDRTQAF